MQNILIIFGRNYNITCRIHTEVIILQIKSNIGKLIDQSPYKREYVRRYFNKSRNTISNWCTGKSYPTVLELFLLAELLKCSTDDMYEVLLEED